MTDCCVKNCKNRKSQLRKSKRQLELEKTVSITFHRIPLNAERRKQWIKALQLDEATTSVTAAVCSQHFQEEMFDRTSVNCVRLRANAVPHIKRETNKEVDTRIIARNFEPNYTMVSERSNTNVLPTVKVEPTSIKKDLSEQISSEELVRILSDEPNIPTVIRTYRECGTCMSPPPPENGPTKEFLWTLLKNTREKYKKKIKLLHQQQRRKDQQIASLRCTLSILLKKKLVQDESYDIATDLDEDTDENLL